MNTTDRATAMRDETCVDCDPDGTRTDLPPATRTLGTGEPVCARHWRERGAYEPGQGFEPTARDFEAFPGGAA